MEKQPGDKDCVWWREISEGVQLMSYHSRKKRFMLADTWVVSEITHSLLCSQHREFYIADYIVGSYSKRNDTCGYHWVHFPSLQHNAWWYIMLVWLVTIGWTLLLTMHCGILWVNYVVYIKSHYTFRQSTKWRTHYKVHCIVGCEWFQIQPRTQSRMIIQTEPE